MSKITSDDVRKVANLSRLDLHEEQIDTYASQLEKILDYIDHLEKVDTTNVIPTTRAVEVINVIRDDQVEYTNVREELIDLAPDREGDFYKVPKIISD